MERFLDVQDGTVVEVLNLDADVVGEDVADDAARDDELAADPDRYVSVPRLTTRDQYAIMAAFDGAVDDDGVSERLRDAMGRQDGCSHAKAMAFVMP